MKWSCDFNRILFTQALASFDRIRWLGESLVKKAAEGAVDTATADLQTLRYKGQAKHNSVGERLAQS